MVSLVFLAEIMRNNRRQRLLVYRNHGQEVGTNLQSSL